MRKLGAAPDYIVGSAHAITDDGEIIVGSGSGSQLGAYAYAGGNVILVVGHQELVRDLDQGLRRIRGYSLPREYVRMQDARYPGSLLAKTLISHYEPSGRISVILVPETLGFQLSIRASLWVPRRPLSGHDCSRGKAVLPTAALDVIALDEHQSSRRQLGRRSLRPGESSSLRSVDLSRRGSSPAGVWSWLMSRGGTAGSSWMRKWRPSRQRTS